MTDTTKRSAGPTIRGYWWQFVVSCARWLELTDDEYMICEGVEDIDIIRPLDNQKHATRYEQLKDYQAKKISVGNKDGRAILANFVSRYVEDIRGGHEPRFRLVTTTERASQKGDVDVIKSWQAREVGEEPEKSFLCAIREALTTAIEEFSNNQKILPERAQQVQHALDWLDDEDSQRWISFLDAVQWNFQYDDLVTSHAKLIDVVEQRVGTELARTIVERLLVELITQVSLGDGNNPRFDRARLDAIFAETQAERDAWASKHVSTLALIQTLLELTLTQTQATKEVLEELSQRVDQNNALLKQLVERGLLEGKPFGIKSTTPVWDELKLHTRASINTQPRVRINQHAPLPRATLEKLQEELLGESTKRLFILEGVGGSGKSTALVTCAKHLLEDAHSVVLLLNLDQIIAGTPIDAIVPNAPHRTPDRLLLEALEETGRSKGVLIIDQLDRLSQVSASSSVKLEYFEQIKQLIMRTIEHKQLNVLVACRGFDRKADSRMKPLTEHERSHTLTLGPLEEEDIRRVVRELGYTPSLTDGQIEILSIPLHLHLLAGLDTHQTQNIPVDEYQLYNHFWDNKRRTLQQRLGSSWSKLHKQICDLFLTNERRFVSAREVEDHLEDIEKLVSEDILRCTKDGFVYFHQRYEEYVFARYFDGDLIDYIMGENQSFLALDQVKSILKDRQQQSSTREQYAQDLRALIFGDFSVSYQRLVSSLLSIQSKFTASEFDLWLEMIASEDPFVRKEARTVLWANPVLVTEFKNRDLLEECFVQGTCNGIALNEEDLSNICRGLFNHLFNQFPKEGAAWFSRLLEDKQNFSWLKASIEKEHCYNNRDVFDVFIESIDAGLWVLDQKYQNQTYMYGLPKKNVAWVAEVATACLHRNLEHLNEQMKDYDTYRKHVDQTFDSLIDGRILVKLAEQTPCAVVEHFTPQLPELLDRFMHTETECWLWRWFRPNSKAPSKDEVWLRTLFSSLNACQDKTVLNAAAQIGASIKNTSDSHRMVRWRLLLAGELEHLRLAVSELAEQLDAGAPLKNPDRFLTTALLLQSASKRLPTEQWQTLLCKLITYQPLTKENEPNNRARDRQLFPLLSALSQDTLSQEAQNVLKDLSNRFSEEASRLSEPSAEVRFVNTLDNVNFDVMDDNEVIDYMCNAQPQSTGPFHDPDKKQTISKATGDTPERFLKILSERFDEVTTDAKTAIVSGWYDMLQKQKDDDFFDDDIWSQILDLSVKLYNEAPEASAMDISLLLDQYPDVPDERVVEMVIDAMLSHPNPTQDWRSDVHDLDTAAINCVRGRMAELLGKWVCNSEEVFEQSREAIIQACQDPFVQVRTNVTYPVFASMNHDRDFAVEQLLEIVRDQPDELLATRFITRYLSYLMHQYLNQLQPIIERMIISEVDEVRKVGGIVFGLSTFVEPWRLNRINTLETDNFIAQGIAIVWTSNIEKLSTDQYSAMIRLFDHSSDDVLQELSGLFRGTKCSWFLDNQHLLDAYLNSRIADFRHNQLFYAFNEWELTENHPDIVLGAIDKMIATKGQTSDEAMAVVSVHEMCDALESIYIQHRAQRDRVTTILDSLVRRGYWGAESTLKTLQKHRD